MTTAAHVLIALWDYPESLDEPDMPTVDDLCLVMQKEGDHHSRDVRHQIEVLRTQGAIIATGAVPVLAITDSCRAVMERSLEGLGGWRRIYNAERAYDRFLAARKAGMLHASAQADSFAQRMRARRLGRKS